MPLQKFEIKETEIRVLEAYARFLKAKGIPIKTEFSTPKAGCDAIQEAMTLWTDNSYDEKKNLFSDMKREGKEDLFPIPDLNWITDNDRACYWVWLNIVNHDQQQPLQDFDGGRTDYSQFAVSPQDLNYNPYRPDPYSRRIDYSQLAVSPQDLKSGPSPLSVRGDARGGTVSRGGFTRGGFNSLQTQYNCHFVNPILSESPKPSSTKERFDDIVRYLDRSRQDLSWQEKLINGLKAQWGDIYSKGDPFSWLKQEDQSQCEWAWDYISRSHSGSFFQFPPTLQSQPLNPKEKYLAIYASYDYWDAHHDTKKLFCQNFNKAWHQKKHRDNRKDKKACNLVLRKEVKKKLDDMAKARGLKLNQLVETLIENEHARQLSRS